MFNRSAITLLLTLFVSGQLLAQVEGVKYNWEQKRDRERIQVYTSKVPGSPYKAVRGEMVIEGSVAELVALINDLPRCSEWADLCKFSRALKVISSDELVVHIYNNVPFPIKDRDVVAHVLWKIDAVTGRVSMFSEALSKEQSSVYLPATKKAVRIYEALTQWHFTPLEAGLVKVENFAHINPNGPIPAWLTNILLVNSPYKTMKSMRAEINSGAYRGAALPF